MPRLAVPTPTQVEGILEESYALWGAGLSLADYTAMWAELAATPWGRRWFSWRAWIDDDGEVVSSLKLYRPLLRLGGAPSRAVAIGAVYTPRARRREGHAARMIRAVLDEAAERGDGPGFLFTDIGVDYYAALGFHALPCEDLVGTLPAPRAPEAAAIALRPAAREDIGAMAAAHDRFCAGRKIAVLRDREHWQFLFVRAESFFRRLDGSGIQRRFMIAERSGVPIGYVVAVEGAGEWNLREAAAYDQAPETLARILRAAGAAAREAGATTVWGWLPRAWVPLVPGWRLKPQPRIRAIPMIRPPGDGPLPEGLDSPEAAFIPYSDQF